MIIDNYDKSGLQVNDLLSKDRLGNHIEKNDEVLRKAVENIYYDNNLEVAIKPVKILSNTSYGKQTQLRTKNLNSDFSKKYKDAIGISNTPVVMAGGIYSNLNSYEDFGLELVEEGHDVGFVKFMDNSTYEIIKSGASVHINENYFKDYGGIPILFQDCGRSIIWITNNTFDMISINRDDINNSIVLLKLLEEFPPDKIMMQNLYLEINNDFDYDELFCEDKYTINRNVNMEKIQAEIKVVTLYAKDNDGSNSFNTNDELNLVIKINSGSEALDLTKIKLNLNQLNIGIKESNLNYLVKGKENKLNYLSTGDLLEISFKITEEFELERLSIYFVNDSNNKISKGSIYNFKYSEGDKLVFS